MESITFSQLMLFEGGRALKATGVLKADVTDQEVLVCVAKVFRAMRAAEPEVIKPEPKLFFPGG